MAVYRRGALGKRNSRRVYTDEGVFDSEGEYGQWCYLKLCQRAGEITDLKYHVWFRLEVNGQLITKYEADFVYIKDGKQVVEDYKGYKGGDPYELFKIKRKLMKAIHGITILET